MGAFLELLPYTYVHSEFPAKSVTVEYPSCSAPNLYSLELSGIILLVQPLFNFVQEETLACFHSYFQATLCTDSWCSHQCARAFFSASVDFIT